MYNYYEEESRFNKKIIIEILVFIGQIIGVVLLAYLVINYGIEATTVYEDSMNPTLVVDDKILVDKFTYHLSEPDRFDVIVFLKTDKEHSYYNIKRIIGLPGETLMLTDNGIYINDKKLEEKIPVEEMDNYGLGAEPITLDENEYFVLGDNRNASEDSRFANIGNVLRDDILGKAWIRVNDFNFISKLNLISAEEPETQE